MSVHNSVTRAGGAIRWLLLAVIPVGSLALLASMNPPLAADQLGNGSVEDVLLTAGRWLGLVLAGWLIVSQILYTLAVLTRTEWMVDFLRPMTLPIVRRIAAGAATVTISFSSVTATAYPLPEPTVIVVDEEASLREEATPTPILQPLVDADPLADIAVQTEGSYSAPLTWLVRSGDHLWSIAGEHLTIVLDRPPTANEHHRYWVKVMESAGPVIRSGDVDLIYPGEKIPLPPMVDAGITP